MRQSLIARLRAGLSAILLMLGLPATASPQDETSGPADIVDVPGPAGRAGIHPWLDEGARVVADVLVDGQLLARLDYVAETRGLKRKPAVEFALPVGLKTLHLKGRLVSPKGKAIKLDHTWKVHDLASMTEPLYDGSLPWIDRVRGLQDTTGGVEVKPYTPEERAEYEAALDTLEKRLGVTLPAPVRVLAEAHILIAGDSYFVKPSGMRTVTEVLLGEWGYKESGKDGLDGFLAPEVRARYGRSVLVLVEVGDGLGALAWDPAGVTAGEPVNAVGDAGNPGAQPGEPGQGVWFWLQQDSIVSPTLLVDDDYRPRDAESAMTKALQRLTPWLDESYESDQVRVDTAHPRNLLQLHVSDGKTPPVLWLRSYDYHFSLY